MRGFLLATVWWCWIFGIAPAWEGFTYACPGQPWYISFSIPALWPYFAVEKISYAAFTGTIKPIRCVEP